MHEIIFGSSLDDQAEYALESAVCQVQEAHGQHVLLNMRDLARIDSRGLGKLFLTYHHLQRHNIRLSIVNPRPVVREMLEFVKLPQIIPVFDSMEDLKQQSGQELPSSPLLAVEV